MQISGYTITFKRSHWTIPQIERAYCLGFEVDRDVIKADLRVTSQKALGVFLRMCYGSFKKSEMEQIRSIYDKIDEEFNTIFSPNLQFPNWQLRQHQREALRDMAHRKYNLLAFTMGLGKTITSASITKMLDLDRTVIVCPALVKWNWYRELTEDWGFNALEFTMIDAEYKTSFQAINERFIIVNFEMIEKYQNHLLSDKIDHIIVDEAHNIKNPDTKKHKLVGRLKHHNPDCRITLLTGTPVTNRVDDMFGYLTMFDHHLGRSKRSFIRKYTVGRKKLAINTKDLRDNLSNCMIRKKTEECVDLPDMNIGKYYFNIADYGKDYLMSKEKFEQSKVEFKRIKKELSKDPDNKELKKQLYKTKLAAQSNIHSLNRIASEYKVPGVCHLANKIISDGRKVIIFSPYRNTLNMLQERYGKKAVLIDGSVPPKEKQRRIQSFLKNKKVMVFLGQVQAAGVGINLVNSCDVIFNGFPFTPDLIEQPIKRAHRMGQTKDVNIYFTIANGSYDEHIYGIVASKLNEINETIDHDKTDVLKMDEIDNNELKELLV